MNMKIPDFIIEEKKENEDLPCNNKSGSEQDIHDFWNNHTRTQPFIKDLLLQEW